MIENRDGDAVAGHSLATAVRDGNVIADAGGAFLLALVQCIEEVIDGRNVSLFKQALGERAEHIFLGLDLDVSENRVAIENVVEGKGCGVCHCGSFLLVVEKNRLVPIGKSGLLTLGCRY